MIIALLAADCACTVREQVLTGDDNGACSCSGQIAVYLSAVSSLYNTLKGTLNYVDQRGSIFFRVQAKQQPGSGFLVAAAPGIPQRIGLCLRLSVQRGMEKGPLLTARPQRIRKKADGPDRACVFGYDRPIDHQWATASHGVAIVPSSISGI